MENKGLGEGWDGSCSSSGFTYLLDGFCRKEQDHISTVAGGGRGGRGGREEEEGKRGRESHPYHPCSHRRLQSHTHFLKQLHTLFPHLLMFSC